MQTYHIPAGTLVGVRKTAADDWQPQRMTRDLTTRQVPGQAGCRTWTFAHEGMQIRVKKVRVTVTRPPKPKPPTGSGEPATRRGKSRPRKPSTRHRQH